MAVGLEWAHTEFVGQGQGVVVERFRLHHVRWVTMHGNLAEEPPGPRLPTPHVMLAGVRKHPLGQPVGLLHIPGAEIDLPTGEGHVGIWCLSSHLLQHSEGVRSAVGHGIGARQCRGSARYKAGMWAS